jgi:hypothetical protein
MVVGMQRGDCHPTLTVRSLPPQYRCRYADSFEDSMPRPAGYSTILKNDPAPAPPSDAGIEAGGAPMTVNES